MLRALGPWTGPDIDKEFASFSGWHPGDVIEGQVYHNTNDEAGTVVLIVLGTGPSECILEYKVLACEDGYYDWYVHGSGDIQNPGFYRVANGSQDDELTQFNGKAVTTIHTWRVLNSNGLGPDLSVVRWLSGKRLENVSVSILECIQDVKTKASEPPPESGESARVARELAKLRLGTKTGEDETGKERRRKKGERKQGRALEPGPPKETERRRALEPDPTKEPEQRTPESKPRKSPFEEAYPEV